MLSRLFKYYGNRNFSQSRIWRNIVKSNPNEPQESPKSAGPVKMDFIPSEMNKKILVWSGKFKSTKDIPERISYGTLEDAKSRFRIRTANVMMALTILLCIYFVWKGKTKSGEGYNMNQLYMEKYGKESKEK